MDYFVVVSKMYGATYISYVRARNARAAALAGRTTITLEKPKRIGGKAFAKRIKEAIRKHRRWEEEEQPNVAWHFKM
jgi:hypothetical protein